LNRIMSTKIEDKKKKKKKHKKHRDKSNNDSKTPKPQLKFVLIK